MAASATTTATIAATLPTLLVGFSSGTDDGETRGGTGVDAAAAGGSFGREGSISTGTVADDAATGGLTLI